MKKYIRKHLKTEKRILKLMYRKGVFETLHISMSDIQWEYLLTGKKHRNRKGRSPYKYRDWLPQLHVYSCDYWGECDSCSVVELYRDLLFWENATEFNENGFPLNSKVVSDKQLVEHLKALPTKNSNSKFNSLLKTNAE